MNYIPSKRIIILALILILFAGNVLLGLKVFISMAEVNIAKETLKTYQHNDKVLNFTKLFIQKVLKTEGTVPFEDYLKLEGAVRDIGDNAILSQWQKFIDSKTEEQAQEEVKNLLEILAEKISY